VPQAAGSATDNIARIVAPGAAKELGQPVIVDNRPGGALTIGIDAVAKAAPDGYTIGQGRSARSPSRATWWRSCPTTSSATCSRSRWSPPATCCSRVSPKTPFHR
jgi:hypothetical protein